MLFLSLNQQYKKALKKNKVCQTTTESSRISSTATYRATARDDNTLTLLQTKFKLTITQHSVHNKIPRLTQTTLSFSVFNNNKHQHHENYLQ